MASPSALPTAGGGPRTPLGPSPDWPSPNLTLLNNALRRTGWQRRPLSEDTWREVVRKRLATVAWGRAVADVRPFLEPSADPALVTHENLVRLLSARRA